MKPRCPVCRRVVERTMRGNIAAHTDALKVDVCPGSGEPWRITILAGPSKVWRRAA